MKEALAAKEVLAQAGREAAAENYDKAKELCYKVLRDYPKNTRALELQAVIKCIESAQIAFKSRNWSDAKNLLEQAQETYPKSELIKQRLDQAQKELTAQQNLGQANDALEHQQFDMAKPLLESIPASSVYFTEAKQKLDLIAKNVVVAGNLSQAQALYRDGHITEALTEVASGLQQAPDNALLLGLQQRARQMEALVKPLEIAEALAQPEDVDVLLRDKKTCDDIATLESDPLNSIRKRALAARDKILEKLVAAAQASAAKAAGLVAGNRKEALNLYNLAVKANPSDQNIVGLRDKLRQKIVADCRTLYQKGIVHEELGQADLARAAYQEVVNTGIPGEDYYERASRKLKVSAP
jgi:tetratricopeptide (TPR) repeat protein